MAEHYILWDLFFYFAATALFVPIFNHFGLGSVLGYLTAGIALGPQGLGLLHHVDNIQEVSHIGIIMLMFVIGLELTPARISHLKKTILMEGTSQFVASTLLLSIPFKLIGNDWSVSLLIAASLSLSSTAFSLSWLKENDRLTKSYGQSSIGILIFQDLIIIPLLMIIPLFSAESGGTQLEASTILVNLGIVTGSLFFSRYILLPVLDKVYRTQAKEIFIGSCLMFVLGFALLMGHLGFSKALGAFVAGIFLSSSRLKSDIQSFSLPIKSMMMGVFFIGFGLSFNLEFFQSNFSKILIYTLGLTGVKALVLVALGLFTGKSKSVSCSLGLVLCQGGEFGILAISSLAQYLLVESSMGQVLLSSITLSIFLGPFFAKLVVIYESRRAKAISVPEQNDESNDNVLELKKAA